ncbi:MAG: oligosaccharide flippase family protein [Burkholderiaceae bacterium]
MSSADGVTPDAAPPSVARSIGWLSLAKLVAQIASWAATLLVMRILDPRDYGIVGLAAAIFTLVFSFAEFGLSKAITQEKRIDRSYSAKRVDSAS